MSLRYRIEITSPKHRVLNEYFIEFRRNESGAESVITDADRATWMTIEFARIAMRRLREPKYQIRCRLLDEYGNEHDGYDNAPDRSAPLSLHNSHEETTYRRDFGNGQGIEAKLIFNRALRKWYLKFTLNPDPTAPPDQSISGDSCDEVMDRFLTNQAIPSFVVDRYRVDTTLPQPTAADTPPAGTLMIAIPVGTVSLGFRPGSIRDQL